MISRWCRALAVSFLFVAGCAASSADSDEGADALQTQDEVASAFASVHDEATRLAGAPSDFAQRIVFLHEMFVDSNGNHAFPEIALHGALWAHNFFSTKTELEQVATLLGITDIAVLAKLESTGDTFGDALEVANRQVFIDSYTNYWFTKKMGTRAGAERFVRSDLLAGLNAVHAAQAPFDRAQRRALFLTALQVEQEQTVAPRVVAAAAAIDPPLLRTIFLRPIVRFSYFPFARFFFFKDFSEKNERIARATDSYEIAEDAGWPNVADAMKTYGALPDEYFADRAGYAAALRAKLLR